MRLQIKPGLRTVWRGDDAVQVGLDEGHGTVLDGLTLPDRELVELLVAGIDDSDLPPAAASPQALRARALVRLLAGRGVLVDRRAGRDALAKVGPNAPRLTPDAAVWSVVHGDAGDGWELLAARAQRVVEIRGAGRTGTALATALAAAGVGQVDLIDERPVTPADVGPAGAVLSDVGNSPSAAVLRAQTALRGPEPPLTAVPASGPDLAVLVHGSAADSTEAAALVTAGLPHLAVVVREHAVLVGPLVLPGRSPCLRCLDLQRADRDPAWPRVLAQLTAGRSGVPEETASALLAASLAALQVLGHLDGRRRPAALAATLEVELPDGLVSRRPWAPHPSCGCASIDVPADSPAEPRVHRERWEPPEGTMKA
jgi:bacteriocin biosynthesis cyclodehydratase domain-containing protein